MTTCQKDDAFMKNKNIPQIKSSTKGSELESERRLMKVKGKRQFTEAENTIRAQVGNSHDSKGG